ncbi:hypothetical protein P2H44_19315 [Albimonas sp. CAU 1670]|uniref:M10 family metallopeptidase C-terminal domain-containing protein n=1 Tax=Albimonas sp. CAU 1670 TaxID=3032599 RepID=UPI0023D9A324|nr:hypothetical protein [Albimonas sp. CAU 1670]MDF2234714.1 hypothetical protein [Albimonas sp. CAU 1670]
MARRPNGAPRIEIDAQAGIVTVSGRATWERAEGRLDPVRARTAYEISFAIEGTPFDPGFTPPKLGRLDKLGRDGALAFGDPLAREGVESGEDLRTGVYQFRGQNLPENVDPAAVAVKGPTGELSIRGLEGTFKSAAAVGFNQKLKAVNSVMIAVSARLEDADGDVVRARLLGLDTWKGELKLSGIGGVEGAAGGSAAGPAGGGAGADVGGAGAGVGVSSAAVRAPQEAGAGTPGDDRLRGDAGEDALRGRAGDDRLLGGRGNDDLRGGRGDDRLTDGAGEDRLTGGQGADVFVLAADGARDAIEDFEPGRDRIDLRAFGPGLDVEALELHRRGDALILRVDGETLEIHGAEGALAPSDLDAADFLLA